MHELILGGMRSGKSRTAELRARGWLDANPAHRAVLIATARVHDEEMRQRVAIHRLDRAARAPGLECVEEAIELPARLRELGDHRCLLVVDCLTMWMTNLLFPMEATARVPDTTSCIDALQRSLIELRQIHAPVVLVSNEIGLGVVPMSSDTRAFVDAIGLAHQSIAEACARVTLMVAGMEVAVKGDAVKGGAA